MNANTHGLLLVKNGGETDYRLPIQVVEYKDEDEITHNGLLFSDGESVALAIQLNNQVHFVGMFDNKDGTLSPLLWPIESRLRDKTTYKPVYKINILPKFTEDLLKIVTHWQSRTISLKLGCDEIFKMDLEEAIQNNNPFVEKL